MNRKLKMFFKGCLVIIGIVFFPLGLFMLGYVIGSQKQKNTIKIDSKNQGKIIETILKENSEENSDRVII